MKAFHHLEDGLVDAAWRELLNRLVVFALDGRRFFEP
jgi:hypothetical protein